MSEVGNKRNSQAREELAKKIMKSMLRHDILRTWLRGNPEGWKLKSGLWSPYYLNLRELQSYPVLYVRATEAITMVIDGIGFKRHGTDRIIGIPEGGTALANGVTFSTGIPSLNLRKLPDKLEGKEEIEAYLSSHGQKELVEGKLRSGDRIAIVDDVIATFESKARAILQINNHIERRGLKNIIFQDVVVLIDREQGGVERGKEYGFDVHSFVTISRALRLIKNEFEVLEYSVLRRYLENPMSYQDPTVQKDLTDLARVKRLV